MLGYINIENKSTDFLQLSKITEESVKHRFSKYCMQEFIYKVLTSPVFLVTYTSERNNCKALHALWF